MDHFTLLDWAVMLAYIVGVTAFGLFKGGKQTSAKDYFLSEKKIGWWVVAMSVVATETSAITFISVPGIAYAGNFNFLQLSIGYILGRIFIATYFLPKYYQGELTTAYALIETRFGLNLRRITSLVFIGTRIFADGVRLYATAIPLALILHGNHFFSTLSDTEFYIYSILFISVVTAVYVQIGGVRAVIWTDLVQLLIYVLAAGLAILVLFQNIPDPLAALAEASAKGKFQFFNFDTTNFFSTPYQFFLAVAGGAFLSMASHGTDYIIVQRLFTTEDLASSKKALIASGIVVFIQFAVFLFVGTLLYAFYGETPLKGDEVFSKFIIESLPAGISGLIIAGILAAAMSTLSGSVSALSSSTVFDLYDKTKHGKTLSEAQKLSLSRIVSLIWIVVLTGSALLYIGLGKSVVEVALSIASFTYGGLLGIFILGIFFERVDQSAAIGGFVSSVIVMTLVVTQTKLAWTLYTIIGSLTAVAVSLLIQRFTTSRQPTLVE
ncbi:MAG: sodium/solute symporter [Chlorobiales bacterium]|nr:sodium/solute symporter [Chlorobiales bacterium]